MFPYGVEHSIKNVYFSRHCLDKTTGFIDIFQIVVLLNNSVCYYHYYLILYTLMSQISSTSIRPWVDACVFAAMQCKEQLVPTRNRTRNILEYPGHDFLKDKMTIEVYIFLTLWTPQVKVQHSKYYCKSAKDYVLSTISKDSLWLISE